MLASLLSTIPISAISPAHEMAFPKVSYTLHESIPYNRRQRARIADEVMQSMMVREGPNVQVRMLPHEEFLSKAGEYDNIPPSAAAFFDGQDIWFSDHYWHKRNPDHFSKMLQHELGHALRMDHNDKDSIMNPSVSVWHNVTDRDKRLIRELRGY